MPKVATLHQKSGGRASESLARNGSVYFGFRVESITSAMRLPTDDVVRIPILLLGDFQHPERRSSTSQVRKTPLSTREYSSPKTWSISPDSALTISACREPGTARDSLITRTTARSFRTKRRVRELIDEDRARKGRGVTIWRLGVLAGSRRLVLNHVVFGEVIKIDSSSVSTEEDAGKRQE